MVCETLSNSPKLGDHCHSPIVITGKLWGARQVHLLQIFNSKTRPRNQLGNIAIEVTATSDFTPDRIYAALPFGDTCVRCQPMFAEDKLASGL